jgi:hypothetical protein
MLNFLTPLARTCSLRFKTIKIMDIKWWIKKSVIPTKIKFLTQWISAIKRSSPTTMNLKQSRSCKNTLTTANLSLFLVLNFLIPKSQSNSLWLWEWQAPLTLSHNMNCRLLIIRSRFRISHTFLQFMVTVALTGKAGLTGYKCKTKMTSILVLSMRWKITCKRMEEMLHLEKIEQSLFSSRMSRN